MAQDEQLAILQRNLGAALKAFRMRRRRDKRKSFALQVSTVVLSGTVTVLLGFKVDVPTAQVLANIALTLGAAVTVLAAIEAFFDHRELWINRTITVRRLEEFERHTQLELAALPAGPPIPQDVIDTFSRRFEQILADDSEAWLELRNASSSIHGAPPHVDGSSSSTNTA